MSLITAAEVMYVFLDLVLLDKKSAAEMRTTFKTMLTDSERRQALIQELIKTNNHLKWAVIIHSIIFIAFIHFFVECYPHIFDALFFWLIWIVRFFLKHMQSSNVQVILFMTVFRQMGFILLITVVTKWSYIFVIFSYLWLEKVSLVIFDN